MKNINRPGQGWKQLSGVVYEHTTGIRIHMLGLIRLPDGKKLSTNQWPLVKELDTLIKINGGNRKRGLMAVSLRYCDE